jgi:hypothetical protein
MSNPSNQQQSAELQLERLKWVRAGIGAVYLVMQLHERVDGDVPDMSDLFYLVQQLQADAIEGGLDEAITALDAELQHACPTPAEAA